MMFVILFQISMSLMSCFCFFVCLLFNPTIHDFVIQNHEVADTAGARERLEFVTSLTILL